jgi:hypothetical protein
VSVNHIISGSESLKEGYAIDEGGALVANSASEQYGEEVEELEELAAKDEDLGRGKRRRVENKQYSAYFWRADDESESDDLICNVLL